MTVDSHIIESSTRALETFIRRVNNAIKPGDLIETIPGFQNIKRYVTALEEGYKSCKMSERLCQEIPLGAAKISAKELYQQLIQRWEPLRPILDEIENGRHIVTHGDAKIQNFIFVEHGEVLEASCLIDVDTAGPGLIIWEWGDYSRSLLSPVKEDQVITTEIGINMDHFESAIRVFAEELGPDFITEQELRHLPKAVGLLGLTLSARFLADYFRGDTYFNVTYPDQNFYAALTQYLIGIGALAQESEMKRIVDRYFTQ